MPSSSRVLLVGTEPSRLQVLSGFLTFHGFVVDVASAAAAAEALLDHVEYRAVVARVGQDEVLAPEWSAFLGVAHARRGGLRTVAMLPAGVSTLGIVADLVVVEDQPIVALAEAVCDTLAA